VQAEVESVVVETDDEGIVIKADNLGSLEAMINLLKAKGVPIRKATIGNVSKKDIADAESNFEQDPLLSVILGFNISVSEEVAALSKKVKIIAKEGQKQGDLYV